VEFRYDELFPRVGFIVTTLEADNRAVVRFSHEGACQVPRSPPRSRSASHRNPAFCDQSLVILPLAPGHDTQRTL